MLILLMNRGEKRKLSIDMTASLNGAVGSAPVIQLTRVRGGQSLNEALLADAPAGPTFVGNVIEFWVDALEWTESVRIRVRASCSADSGERPVEQDVMLLIQ